MRILSYSSLDLCLVLCTLPPLMSCTVHSPTDSLARPTCILVYKECNPAPGGSPFELSLGLHSSSRVLLPPFLLRVSCVVVCPRFCLGSPQTRTRSLGRVQSATTQPQNGMRAQNGIMEKTYLLQKTSLLEARRASTMESSDAKTHARA